MNTTLYDFYFNKNVYKTQYRQHNVKFGKNWYVYTEMIEFGKQPSNNNSIYIGTQELKEYENVIDGYKSDAIKIRKSRIKKFLTLSTEVVNINHNEIFEL